MPSTRPVRQAAQRAALARSPSTESDSDSSTLTDTRTPTPPPKRRRSSSTGKGAKRNGVVPRSKDGCWSCRIRRKKCHGHHDTIPSDCVDCVRLGIECLGWGDKRPEWLKAKDDVNELRGKFTGSLRSRNMIKGERKSTVERTPKVEREETEAFDTRSMADEDEEDDVNDPVPIPVHVHPVLVEDEPSTVIFDGSPLSGMIPFSPLISPLIAGSGAMGYGITSSTGFGPITPPGEPMLMGHSLAARQLEGADDISDDELITADHSPLFDTTADVGYPTPDGLDGMVCSPGSATGMAFPFGLELGYRIFPDEEQGPWWSHYVFDVLPMQYLMTGTDLKQLMTSLAYGSDPSAMLSLAALHFRQSGGGGDADLHRKFLATAIGTLRRSRQSFQALSKENAMSALHVVSVSLFSGCKEPWIDALNYARDWYQQAFSGYKTAQDFIHALLNADTMTKFTAKTTMWMDIFGAISSQSVPRFINWYRTLFRPGRAGLVGRNGGINDEQSLQMTETMGAENDVMLAFAEIAALDAWKVRQKHALSIPELSKKGDRIERELLTPRGSPSPKHRPLNPFHGPHAMPSTPFAQPSSSYDAFTPYQSSYHPYPPAYIHEDQPMALQEPPLDEAAEARQRMSAVFRASARVYLNSVLSGCNPQVPEIRKAVADTITCLKELVSTEEKPYDRSLALPVFIAGVMTDDPEQQEFLAGRLQNIKKIKIGNCSQILHLMQCVWGKRRASGGAEVDWRATMKELGMTLLFV